MSIFHKLWPVIRGVCHSPSSSHSVFSPLRRVLSSSAAKATLPQMSTKLDRSLYILPNDSPVCLLDCGEAFKALTSVEKQYAHHLTQASYYGSLAVFLQVSPESAAIFSTFYRLFKAEDMEELKNKSLSVGFTEAEWTTLLVYVAGFYNNSGNYKGFGDSKIVPGLAVSKITELLKKSKAANKYPTFLKTWAAVEQRVDSLDERQLQLGFADKGVTTYHSENITAEDADFVAGFLKKENIETWNTRLMKDFSSDKADKKVYRVLLASVEKGIVKEYEYEGATIIIEKGDYSPIMGRLIGHLKQAVPVSANDNQKQMIEKYISHFTTGNINDHKDGSRFWIKDQGPTVESYIGFIENYRDPAGTRSEFEGFVSCVNKETSKKFQQLVENAEQILPRLPWGTAYEKDKFLKPDFTALDVIAFGSSGIPAGINIPNYDDIRQNEGFKNVSLGNVISATPKQKMNFLSEEDEDLMFKYYKESFEVQVGLHELLGHGSGKLFQRNKDGTFNFDRNTTDLITGKPVDKWYEPGETWGSKFGQLSSAYEECRAEGVGYVLSCDADILKIFGYTGELAEKVKYVNWLNEIRAGLLALEFYNAEQQKWGQAHCYARWVLTRVCLEAGQGFITIEDRMGEDGKPDLMFKLDQKKIDSVGKPAVTDFLAKLQAYKSTGDFEGGKALFESYGKVDKDGLKWRKICIARRKPRRLFVQSNTAISGDEVKLLTYPASAEGIIQSFVERYNEESIDELEQCWQENKHYFPSAY